MTYLSKFSASYMKRNRNHKSPSKNEETSEKKSPKHNLRDSFIEGIILSTENELSSVKTDFRDYLSVLKECKQKADQAKKLKSLSSNEGLGFKKHISKFKSSNSSVAKKVNTPRTPRSRSGKSDNITTEKMPERQNKSNKKGNNDFSSIPESDEDIENRPVIESSEEHSSENLQKRHNNDKKNSRSRTPSPVQNICENPTKCYNSNNCKNRYCDRTFRKTQTVQTEFTVRPEQDANFELYDIPEAPFPSTVEIPENFDNSEPEMEKSNQKPLLAVQVLPAVKIKRPLVTQKMPDVVIESNFEPIEKNRIKNDNIQYVELVHEDKKMNLKTFPEIDIVSYSDIIHEEGNESEIIAETDKKKPEINKIEFCKVPEVLNKNICEQSSCDKKREAKKSISEDLNLNKNICQQSPCVKTKANKTKNEKLKLNKNICEQSPCVKTKEAKKTISEEVNLNKNICERSPCDKTKETNKTINEELNLNINDIPSVKTLKKIQYHLEQKCALIRQRLDNERNLQPGEYISLRWKLNQPPKWKCSATEIDEKQIILLPKIPCAPCESSSEISLNKEAPNLKDNCTQYSLETEKVKPCFKLKTIITPCESCDSVPQNKIDNSADISESNQEIELGNLHLIPKTEIRPSVDCSVQCCPEQPKIPQEEIIEEPKIEVEEPPKVSPKKVGKECQKETCSGKLVERDVFAEYMTSGMPKSFRQRLKNLTCPKRKCTMKQPVEKILEKKLEKTNLEPVVIDSDPDCCKNKETKIGPEKQKESEKYSPEPGTSKENLYLVDDEEIVETQEPVDTNQNRPILKTQTNLEECNINKKKVTVPEDIPCCTDNQDEPIKNIEEKTNLELKIGDCYQECGVKQKDVFSDYLTSGMPKSKKSKILKCPEQTCEKIDLSKMKEVHYEEENNSSDEDLENQNIPVQKLQKQEAPRNIVLKDASSQTKTRIVEKSAECATVIIPNEETNSKLQNGDCNKKCRVEQKDVFSDYITSGMPKSKKSNILKCPKQICAKIDLSKIRKTCNDPEDNSSENELENENIPVQEAPRNIVLKDNSAQTEAQIEEYPDYIICKQYPKIKFITDADIQQICNQKCEHKKYVKRICTNLSTFKDTENICKPATIPNINDYKITETKPCCSKKCDSTSESSSSDYYKSFPKKINKFSTPIVASPVTSTSDEILSDGEIKLSCECSTSIGEIHLCHFANKIRKRNKNGKENPKQLIKETRCSKTYDVPCLYKYNDNWVTYYVSKENQALSSGEVGSDTNWSSVTNNSQ